MTAGLFVAIGVLFLGIAIGAVGAILLIGWHDDQTHRRVVNPGTIHEGVCCCAFLDESRAQCQGLLEQNGHLATVAVEGANGELRRVRFGG